MSVEFSPADVIAARNGDQRAFARIVDGTRNLICSIAYATLRDVDRSEDCAQEVYLSAWQGIGKLKDPSSLLPWLRQITRYRAADILRESVRVRSRHLDSEKSENALLSHPDPARDPMTRLVDQERMELLEEGLTALDAETREIVILYHREEQSTKTVAELLGLTEVAVRKRLSRARAELREAVLERVEDHAKRTAPTAALTAAVVSGLAMAAPSTAAAASVAIAKGASSGAAGKALLAFLGSIAGPLIAILAVAAGALRQLRLTTDPIERTAMKKVAVLNVFFSGTAAIAWNSHQLWSINALIVLPYFWLLGGLYWSMMVILERARQPRYARELEAEGEVAAIRHRRAARFRWLSLGTGALVGGLNIVVALILRGN